MSPSQLTDQLLAGDRRALARAVTLVESTREDHRDEARALLEEVVPHTGGSMRLGISGAPGAGKSSLIEALGLRAIAAGHKVAVLTIDPSSSISGGSILGDKTRMPDLSREADAFIRPSPSSGTLGGVARRTREAMLVCEAAGFDLVIVETVGVGQSEGTVSELVDLFLLVAAPAGGDELQGIKRGIMELVDVVAVNKADGDLLAAANRAAADFGHALHLLRPKRPGASVEVLICSALTGAGIAELWDHLVATHASLIGAEALNELRSRPNVAWMWSEVTDALLDRLRSHPGAQDRLRALEAAVSDGTMSPTAAAHDVLSRFLEG